MIYGSALSLRVSHFVNEPLRVLLITNEATEGAEPGFRHALEALHAAREIEGCAAIAPKPLAARSGIDSAHRDLLHVVRTMRPNVVIVMSPSTSPFEADAIHLINQHLPHAVILYWEGDAWGPGKQPTDAMRAWATHADVVFSVAMGEQAQLLHEIGARDVQHTLQSYCHVQFGDYEGETESQRPQDDCALIGSGLARWGLVSRIPGAADRARLVRMMQRRIAKPAIYGPGFRGHGTRGPLSFDRQVAAIRQARISVNWDHYPSYSGYSSNRLPISMLAGRPHVTTRHPDSSWLPGEEHGIFLGNSPREVLTIALHLLSQPQGHLDQFGKAAHEWVVGRMSKREAMRFMLGRVDSHIAESLPSPWGSLVRSVSDSTIATLS